MSPISKMVVTVGELRTKEMEKSKKRKKNKKYFNCNVLKNQFEFKHLSLF